jgi:putative membrane protein
LKNIAKIIGVIVVILVALLLLGGAAMLTVGRFGLMGRGIARGFGMMGRFGTIGRGISPFGAPFGFGFGPFGFLLMLFVFALVLGAVVAFILWVVRSERIVRSTAPTVAAAAPIEILKERYARGEITKEQFEGMQRDLGV